MIIDSPTHTRRSVSARPTAVPTEAGLWDALAAQAHSVEVNIGRVISGKPDAIRLAVTAFLAGGHLLIEDVPGVGKTMLAKALATSMGATVRRIQFTPDLLPSDVTGAPIFNQETRQFDFEPGPIFANIVIGDEINRASPRTQSALLECMEERQVTVEGTTYALDDPFLVVATQNPIDMEGTHTLMEAQRDRFMMRIAMGYPDEGAEQAMVKARANGEPIKQIGSVVPLATVRDMIGACRQVHVADAITAYAVAITRATRHHQALRLGASPRAAVHLVAAARAYAAMHGRGHVLPDDIQALAEPVLAHRLMAISPASGVEAAAQLRAIVRAVLAGVRVPVPLR
ncbi:MAG: MoxR family ATPase [Bifidobacteriaceae bacterium]|nr:MoxR family ATPase [Bifidobacteriaceae bacterium]